MVSGQRGWRVCVHSGLETKNRGKNCIATLRAHGRSCARHIAIICNCKRERACEFRFASSLVLCRSWSMDDSVLQAPTKFRSFQRKQRNGHSISQPESIRMNRGWDSGFPAEGTDFSGFCVRGMQQPFTLRVQELVRDGF